MKALRNLNPALLFLLELSMLAAFGYWGFRAGQAVLGGVLAGLFIVNRVGDRFSSEGPTPKRLRARCAP